MEDRNYIVIQGWMRTRLNLKGSELLAYALIYGFSQDGETWFTGSARYVSEWLGIDRRNAIDVLKRLADKGLIIKQERSMNGVKFADYRADMNIIPSDETSLGGGDETSHHNNNLDKDRIIKKERSKERKSDDQIEQYHFSEEKRKALDEFIKMRMLIKKPLTFHALELVLKKLETMGDERTQIAILEQSITNCWQGIFPLKDNEKKGCHVAHEASEYDKDFNEDGTFKW